MVIASEITFYKKEDEVREVSLEILKPVFCENAWECQLLMRGYGEVDRKLYGQSSIQALSAVMQHAKFNLTLMVNDGFNYFDNDENKELSTEETLELLDAVYGHGTLLDEQHKKAICLQVIKRLQHTQGTEEEQDADINYLKKEFADPNIIDYIFHRKPKLSALEIYEKAKAYKPIIL
jgi:hypothetical protein